MANRNIEAIRTGYDAFGARDLETALSVFDDSAEWIVNGESAIGGIYRGKAEIAELLGRVAAKVVRIQPTRFVVEGDFFVVLSELHFGARIARQADVYEFRHAKVVKARTYGDTAMQERIFGSQRVAAE